MSPKEFEFLITSIENAAKAFYSQGYRDGKNGAEELPANRLVMDPATRMLLSTQLKKINENR